MILFDEPSAGIAQRETEALVPALRNLRAVTGASLVVDGDRAAARLRYTGTHTGDLAGMPATGRRFHYAGAAFFTALDGRLTSAWVLGDLEGLRRQLAGDRTG